METLKTREASHREANTMEVMAAIGRAARAAAHALSLASSETKNLAIRKAAGSIRARAADILAANGLLIERVATPLGVIGVIYESRPAVTADAGALCLKAGNAVILRAGSKSFFSARCVHECLAMGLDAAGLPAAALSLVPVKDRAAVGGI